VTARNWMLMRCGLEGPVPAPQWPSGFRLLDLTAGTPEAFHALLAEVYAGDPGLLPFADWWRAVEDDPEFDPELCYLLLTETDEVAAVALCWNSGFLKDIAVHPAHRRRGLGRALLLHLLGTFRERGLARVDLKVAKNNPDRAWKLYESVGFKRVPLGDEEE
jgi:ribosomal protein S18 acetylase RimI-like enzyme